jgi:hypothetical protein
MIRPISAQVIRANLKLSQAAFAGLMGLVCEQFKTGSRGGASQVDLLRLCCESLSEDQKFYSSFLIES